MREESVREKIQRLVVQPHQPRINGSQTAEKDSRGSMTWLRNFFLFYFLSAFLILNSIFIEIKFIYFKY